MSEKDTNASHAETIARNELIDLLSDAPLSTEDLSSNLNMYTRASALVKILVLDDLYRRILDVPGAIVEFGCWYGQNLILFENLRAIHEPFNKSRKIVGFDSFSGYTGHTGQDADSNVFEKGNFSTGENYPEYLRKLLVKHEQANVLGHITGMHDVVQGDIKKTTKDYFDRNKGLHVALAYLDVGLYEPTKAALEAIKPRLLPGSIILLDEFTWQEAEGEAIAFREVFAEVNWKIEKSRLTPLRAIVTVLP